MAVAACLAACGGDDEGGGNGELGSCGQLSGCGGDLVGTWTIDGACTDNLIQLMGGGSVEAPECAGLIADTQTDATGTFTFTETTMSATATLSIDVTARYTPACAMAIANGTVDLAAVCSSLGDQYAQMGTVSGVSCSIVGANCDCILSFDQPLSTSNSYTASGGTITYAGDPDPVTYCVDGNKLKMGGRMGDASMLLTLTR